MTTPPTPTSEQAANEIFDDWVKVFPGSAMGIGPAARSALLGAFELALTAAGRPEKGWIALSDAAPPEGSNIATMRTCTCCTKPHRILSGEVNFAPSSFQNFTHWMMLPPLPQTSTQGAEKK